MAEWRTTLDFPNYAVSDAGEVARIDAAGNRSVLKPFLDRRGYPSVSIWQNNIRYGRKVHRLVLETFVGPRPSTNHVCAHGDGTRTNNALSNLRWATQAENHADKLLHGTHNRGERHGLAKLTTAQVVEARLLRAVGATIAELAERYRVAKGTMKKALCGESWSWLPNL